MAFRLRSRRDLLRRCVCGNGRRDQGTGRNTPRQRGQRDSKHAPSAVSQRSRHANGSLAKPIDHAASPRHQQHRVARHPGPDSGDSRVRDQRPRDVYPARYDSGSVGFVARQFDVVRCRRECGRDGRSLGNGHAVRIRRRTQDCRHRERAGRRFLLVEHCCGRVTVVGRSPDQTTGSSTLLWVGLPTRPLTVVGRSPDQTTGSSTSSSSRVPHREPGAIRRTMRTGRRGLRTGLRWQWFNESAGRAAFFAKHDEDHRRPDFVGLFGDLFARITYSRQA
jgi:hypothetical protein